MIVAACLYLIIACRIGGIMNRAGREHHRSAFQGLAVRSGNRTFQKMFLGYGNIVITYLPLDHDHGISPLVYLSGCWRNHKDGKKK